MLTLVDISMKNYHTAGLYSLLSSIFFLQFISFKFISSRDYCGMHKLLHLQYIPNILNSHIMSSCIFWNDQKSPENTYFLWPKNVCLYWTHIEFMVILKTFWGSPQEQILVLRFSPRYIEVIFWTEVGFFVLYNILNTPTPRINISISVHCQSFYIL